ncbi:MAG TPA: DUF433 domain-containing protein [Tepidisphaeraceae bacterium]|jgi:uncharacterized protein (DUF433 family)
MNLIERITIEPGKRSGQPCVRRMRVTVSDVLELLADGLTPAEVVEQLPWLEPDDVRACLMYAAERMSHPTTLAQ